MLFAQHFVIPHRPWFANAWLMEGVDGVPSNWSRHTRHASVAGVSAAMGDSAGTSDCSTSECVGSVAPPLSLTATPCSTTSGIGAAGEGAASARRRDLLEPSTTCWDEEPTPSPKELCTQSQLVPNTAWQWGFSHWPLLTPWGHCLSLDQATTVSCAAACGSRACRRHTPHLHAHVQVVSSTVLGDTSTQKPRPSSKGTWNCL